MSSGSSTPQNVVTTQNKDPWAGAQPHLAGILNNAASLYSNDIGYAPYTGSTQAGINPVLQGGLDATYSLLPGGTAGTEAGFGLANNVINSQGITPGIQTALNNMASVSAPQYNQIYNDAAGQQNPYLQGLMDAQGRKIADQVNSAMSGAGRYGSGAHTNVLSRNLAEAQLPLLAQDYQNRQQTRLAANAGLQNVYGQQADLYGQGLNRAGQFSQLAPTLEAARFAGADRATQLGNFYQSRNQQDLQAQIDAYNAYAARPWEQLARYNAIAGGAGGLGGSQVTSAPNLNAPVGGLQGALGGALAGGATGSIFGPVGAGIGALGGGLLGYMR